MAEALILPPLTSEYWFLAGLKLTLSVLRCTTFYQEHSTQVTWLSPEYGRCCIEAILTQRRHGTLLRLMTENLTLICFLFFVFCFPVFVALAGLVFALESKPALNSPQTSCNPEYWDQKCLAFISKV